MLSIRINRESWLDLNVSTLSITKRSPIFADLDGSFAYNFKIPATDNNRKIFGLVHMPESNAENSAQLCEIFFKGLLQETGVIKAVSGNSQTYEVAIGLAKGSFFYNLKNKLLQDLDYDDVSMGSDTQDVVDYAKAQTALAWPVAEVQFPTIYHPFFYGEAKEYNLDFAGIINSYARDVAVYNVNDIHADPTADNEYALCPQPYMMGIIKKIFTDAGFMLNGDFLEDADLMKVLLYSNYAIDKKEVKWYIEAQYDPDNIQHILSLEQPSINAPIEVVDLDACWATNKYTVKEEGYHRIQANISFVWDSAGDSTVWIEISGGTGQIYTESHAAYSTPDIYNIDTTVFLDGGEVGNEVTIRVVNTTLVAGDITEAYIVITNVSRCDLNIYDTAYNVAKLLPVKTKQIDFLDTLIKKTFCAAVFVDNNNNTASVKLIKNIITQNDYIDWTDAVDCMPEITLQDARKDIFNFAFPSDDGRVSNNFPKLDFTWIEYDSYDDLPDNPSIGDIALITSHNVFYRYGPDENNTVAWYYFADNFYDYTVGTGESQTEHNPAVGPLFNYTDAAVELIVPRIEQVGTSPAELMQTEFNLHLMLWNGMITDILNQPYPCASCTNLRWDGTAIGNLSLRWDDTTYGIYARYWKTFINFLRQTKFVKFRKYMSALELSQLDFSKKYRINHVDYLLAEVRYSLGADEMILAEIDAYSC